MFSRFTEKSIQAIINAQEIAHKANSEFLGTEHLLLSLITSKEKENIVRQTLEQLNIPEDKIIKTLEDMIKSAGKGNGGSGIPFTPQVKKALSYAWDEARQLGHNYVSVEHIFLALLREQDGIAAKVLSKFNVSIAKAREVIVSFLGVEVSAVKEVRLPQDTPLVNEFTRDITWLAAQNKLDPVIGRDREIERLVQILSRRTKNNPVLIGDAGIGKTAIVEGSKTCLRKLKKRPILSCLLMSFIQSSAPALPRDHWM